MASSSFLPLTKQSSIISDKKLSISQLSKSNSYNPFDIAVEIKNEKELRHTLMDKMDDQKSNYYIEETYLKWRGLYIKALSNKQKFLQVSKDEFYSAFVQNPEDYAREIFLDPS